MTRAMSLSVIVVLGLVAMAAAPYQSFVFMQIADPQMGMFSNNNVSQREIDNLTAVVKEANRLHPKFLIICGDLMNSSSSDEQLKSFRDSISLLKDVPVHLVAGNHDVGNQPSPESLSLYRQRFGPDYYEFRSGPFTGIVLDSMLMGDSVAPKASADQYAWLQQTLKRASRVQGGQIAIFQHKPFFVHSADEPDKYWNVPLKARVRYLTLLRQYNVKHVFAGHLHYPNYGHSDDLEIITAGATGKPLNHSVSGLNLVQVSTHASGSISGSRLRQCLSSFNHRGEVNSSRCSWNSLLVRLLPLSAQGRMHVIRDYVSTRASLVTRPVWFQSDT